MSKKPRRRAQLVSAVDQRLIDHGLPPSWEQSVTDADLDVAAESHTDDPRNDTRGDGANDARLLDNVPPHAQTRI